MVQHSLRILVSKDKAITIMGSVHSLKKKKKVSGVEIHIRGLKHVSALRLAFRKTFPGQARVLFCTACLEAFHGVSQSEVSWYLNYGVLLVSRTSDSKLALVEQILFCLRRCYSPVHGFQILFLCLFLSLRLFQLYFIP